MVGKHANLVKGKQMHEHVATVVGQSELLLEELGEGLAVLLVSGWVDITQAGLCRSLKDVEKDRVIDVQ